LSAAFQIRRVKLKLSLPARSGYAGVSSNGVGGFIRTSSGSTQARPEKTGKNEKNAIINNYHRNDIFTEGSNK